MRHRELLNVALVTLIAASAACAGTAGSSPPPPVSPPMAGEPATPTESTPPTSGDPTAPPPAAGGTLLADGQPCFDSGSCNSGVCEGQGCTQAEPGTCAPKARACTRDMRAYCGCDGVTFNTSGSCPGRRFASKGACAGGAP